MSLLELVMLDLICIKNIQYKAIYANQKHDDDYILKGNFYNAVLFYKFANHFAPTLNALTKDSMVRWASLLHTKCL